MKISQIINEFVSGDWGNETSSEEASNPVFCIRGADIVSIIKHDFNEIPRRYISNKSFKTKLLQVGDIVIEKSGGSPAQSTGRVVFISEDLIKDKKEIVCSNFCTAFRVKEGWNPYFVYQYWQNVYNANIFFNFEGKTSGIKNLQLDAAISAIEIDENLKEVQNRIVLTLHYYEEKININRAINQNLPTPDHSSEVVIIRLVA